jgi:hypothetical protein
MRNGDSSQNYASKCESLFEMLVVQAVEKTYATALMSLFRKYDFNRILFEDVVHYLLE